MTDCVIRRSPIFIARVNVAIMGEPDSWESLADPNDADVLGTNSALNPDALAFSLNVHAQEFVPSFLRKPEASGKK